MRGHSDGESRSRPAGARLALSIAEPHTGDLRVKLKPLAIPVIVALCISAVLSLAATPTAYAVMPSLRGKPSLRKMVADE